MSFPSSPRILLSLILTGLYGFSLPYQSGAMETTQKTEEQNPASEQTAFPSFPVSHAGVPKLIIWSSQEGRYVPSEHIRALCRAFKELFNITEEKVNSLSLKAINELFQTHFLRDPHVDRADYLSSERAQKLIQFFKEQKRALEIKKLLVNLKFFYDYPFETALDQANGHISIGILNASFPVFLNRMKFFLNGWVQEQKKPASKEKLDKALLLVLSGDREASQGEEESTRKICEELNLKSPPFNEKDFLPWLQGLTPQQLADLFKEYGLELSLDTWKKLEPVIKKIHHRVSPKDDKGNRATTVDNFREWFDVLSKEEIAQDTPISLIPVSSQPFVMHQAAASTGPWLNSAFKDRKIQLLMTGIGVRGQKKHEISLLSEEEMTDKIVILSLDSIARIVFESLRNIEKSNLKHF